MNSLASYAMPTGQSQGRRYPEPGHPYRTPFQRDRDRIIHSRAFRRLEAKTQVFTRKFSDHFRDRLTHTLEVTQIARTVAGALGLNEELCEGLALVHDIGHPPFGHAGEARLDEFMRLVGERFDHNLHALRTVENFEQRYAAFPGLNLTFEMREGIIKHSRDYDPAAYPHLAEYRLENRPPLEAQLVDLADEIAYSSADLDDGLESKLLTTEMMAEEVPLVGKLLEEARAEFPGALPKLQFNQALRRLIDTLTTDLIENTRRTLEENKITSVEAVRAWPERLAGFSPAVEEQKNTLKEFLHRLLYNHPQITLERQRAVACLGELIELYTRHPDRLPPSYAGKVEQGGLHRVVCDYMAGMTDNFVFRVYDENFESRESIQ